MEKLFFIEWTAYDPKKIDDHIEAIKKYFTIAAIRIGEKKMIGKHFTILLQK